MPAQPGTPVTSNHPYMDKVHKIYSNDWAYADETARLADTDFIAEDVGRVAQQDSPLSWWVLVNHSPVTWEPLGGSGVGEITIRKNGGADVGTRPRINLIEGTGITLTVADDAGDDEVDVTIDAAAGFPLNVITVDVTDPDANYDNIADAAAAAVPGDMILIGPGTYDCDEVDLPAGVFVRGQGGGYEGGATILQNSLQTSEYCLGITGDVSNSYTRLYDMRVRIKCNAAGSAIGAIKSVALSPYISLQNCFVFSDNDQAGNDSWCFLGDFDEIDVLGGFYEAYSSAADEGMARDSVFVWAYGLPILPLELGPLASGYGLVGDHNDTGVRFLETSPSVRVNEFSTDGTLGDNSDDAVPTEQAVKTYVDGQAKFDVPLIVPGLRGWWPMGRITPAGAVGDQSGNGMDLTLNGGAIIARGNKYPYVVLDGTGDYLLRADEAFLDILGTEATLQSASRGFTIMGWVRFDNAAATGEWIAAKYDYNGGPAVGSWYLYRDLVGRLVFNLFSGGSFATQSDATIPATTWTFVAARWIPSTSLSTWVGSTLKTSATGVASLPDVAAPLTFGVFYDTVSGHSGFMSGRQSNFVLAGANLADDMVDLYRVQTAPLYV